MFAKCDLFILFILELEQIDVCLLDKKAKFTYSFLLVKYRLNVDIQPNIALKQRIEPS
jgi:hypothetical protein